MHYHVNADARMKIYRFLAGSIRDAWRGHAPVPVVALCKEPRPIRKEVGLDHYMCNCG